MSAGCGAVSVVGWHGSAVPPGLSKLALTYWHCSAVASASCWAPTRALLITGFRSVKRWVYPDHRAENENVGSQADFADRSFHTAALWRGLGGVRSGFFSSAPARRAR